MSLWAEAWDLPHLASPGKKVAYVPVLDARFGRHADAFREEGSMSIPAAWSRLDEVLHVDSVDHSNDVGSVIHLFQRNTLGGDSKPRVVGSFVAERRPDSLTSPATAETQISGRGLTSYFLDRVKLWAFDYPADPTKEDDWIFGGENILSNPGMEDGAGQGAEWVIWLDEDVDGGTWTFEVGGDETTPLDWDASTTDIGAAVVLAIPGLIAVSVSGSGTEESPWVITVTDPVGDDPGAFFPSGASANDIDLDNGTIHLETVRNGGGVELSAWTRSVNLDRGGREHGRYASDGFRLTTDGEPVRSGLYALRVNGLSRFAGAMQVVSVIPGHRYTASIWARTGSATNIFRFIIRDRFEGFIGGPDGLGGRTLTPSTWTLFTYTFIATTDQIVMRFAVVGDTVAGPTVNPDPFYLDDGSMAPGVPATTLGDILLQMLLDAGVDHFAEVGRNALLFLVPTFDATLDSGGNAWDAVRSVTLNAGDSYGQIVEAFQQLWRYVVRIRFDREDNIYYLDAFNPGYVEVDHETTNTGTLMVGMNILGGEVIRRAPDATAFRVFGDDGSWAEDTDTDLLVPWGWADSKPEKVGVGSSDDLMDVILAEMAVNRDQMITVEVEMTSQGQVIPLQHVDVFHRIKVNLGGKSSIAPEYLIVTSIVTSFKPGGRPSYQVFVNSDAFASTGAAALAEAVRRLLRKGQRNLKNFGGSVLGGGAGGDPTIFVAAFDASQQSKDIAHYIVQDIDDAREAIDAAQGDLASIFPATGRLVLSEGHFYIPGLYSFGEPGGEGIDPLIFDTHGLGDNRTIIISTTEPTGTQVAIDFRGFADHLRVDQTYEET